MTSQLRGAMIVMSYQRKSSLDCMSSILQRTYPCPHVVSWSKHARVFGSSNTNHTNPNLDQMDLNIYIYMYMYNCIIHVDQPTQFKAYKIIHAQTQAGRPKSFPTMRQASIGAQTPLLSIWPTQVLFSCEICR